MGKETDVDPDTLGGRIRELRKHQGLFMKGLAEKVGRNVTTSMVSDWENNKVVPSLDYLAKLGELFGVSVEYLRTGKRSSGAGVTLLPDQLRRVVSDQQWKSLPENVRRGVALAMTEVDLPDHEVMTIIGALLRGREAYAQRTGKR